MRSITVSIVPGGSPACLASSLSQSKSSAAKTTARTWSSSSSDRIAEIDGGFVGDAPDLILADGEVTGLNGAPKIDPVAKVDLVGDRDGGANDVAIGVDDSQVGIRRILREQIGEERSCRRRDYDRERRGIAPGSSRSWRASSISRS